MPKKCKEEEKQDIEIAVLKEQFMEIKSSFVEIKLSIEEIKTKHLLHIYNSLNEINLKIATLSVWDKIKSISLIAASGIIGSLLTYVLLK